MHILVTGGTGYIGRALCAKLHERGHQITVLTRQSSAASARSNRAIRFIASLDEIVATEQINAIVNLAGKPIADSLWTPKRKAILEQSRTGVTHDLLALM